MKISTNRILLPFVALLFSFNAWAQPTVSPANITVSGATGNVSTFIIGNTVTASWNNTAGGDNNAGVTGVDFDFTAFGGGVVAGTNSSETWSATYNIVIGTIETTVAKVSVTATDGTPTGPIAMATNANVDNQPPSATGIVSDISVISDSDAGGQVTFTVSFDETMDTGVDPTIDFPVEDPTADLTFNGGLSGWNGNDYEAVYDIADNGTELLNIDIRVTGGQDAAGNALSAAYTEANEFDIDTQNPNLTAAAATPSTGTLIITDGLTIDITEGSGEAGLTVSSATINGVDVLASFSDNTGGAYDFTYTVAGGHTDQSAGNIPISITLQDAAGNTSNTLIAWTDANTTAIDANAPTATGLVSDISLISDIDAGSQVTFTVFVT